MDTRTARNGDTRLRAHYELVRVLTEASTVDEATQKLLELIGRAFGWPLGVLWTVDPTADVLRHTDEWIDGGIDVGDFVELSRGLTFERGVGLPGRVWARGEPAWIADFKRDPNFPRGEVALRSGLRAGVGLPVFGRDGVLGVMEFFAPPVRVPDPDQLELMRTVGRQVGQFVERRRAEDLLQRSEELKSAIIDSSLDCVITMDRRGLIVDFNPAAVETFGHAREDAIGAELAALIIPPSLREAHRAALGRYLETGEGAILNRRMELTGLRANGEEFPLELTVTRIGTGEPPLFTGFVRDITERRRSAVELAQLLEAERDARVRAEEAERHASRLAETLQQSLLPPSCPSCRTSTSPRPTAPAARASTSGATSTTSSSSTTAPGGSRSATSAARAPRRRRSPRSRATRSGPPRATSVCPATCSAGSTRRWPSATAAGRSARSPTRSSSRGPARRGCSSRSAAIRARCSCVRAAAWSRSGSRGRCSASTPACACRTPRPSSSRATRSCSSPTA